VVDSVSGVGVLDKAITILVAATGIPRPTAHRLATALEDHGLVRRDRDGRFTLGLRLVALGHAAAGELPITEAARPALEELRDVTGESVQLYVRDGDRRVCTLSLESPHGLRTIVPLGSVLPLDRGSAGKVLRGEWNRDGWAESVAEREAGVASVSAPVLDGAGRVLAAVSVSGPIERTTRTPGRRYGRAVVAAAQGVSKVTGSVLS
jgi:DNA-binding IclR family transcriptional regulator